MPKHEEHGQSAVPEGYVGKAIAVMECPIHGAHINLDLYLAPMQRWDVATMLAGSVMDTDAPLPIDQLTPEQAETFARDLLEAATEARQVIASAKN